MKKYILVSLVIISLMSFQKQQVYEVEDTIGNFSLPNAMDNAMVSLSDFANAKVVVIVFNSPGCAFSRIYDERLVNLSKEYKDKGVNFIFINPNNPSVSPDDNAEAMVKRAKEKGYHFPFLIDGDQKIATAFGATKTPEVFVLKNLNGAFVLKYKGAIDDNPQLASEVTAYYLKDAIVSVMNNSAVKISEKRATGCMIKK
ncbi:MAG: thioredoxin family protein [Cytophagaceae bacterium]|nr:thioredoxin family protein [Cytophagaceae bacterium]